MRKKFSPKFKKIFALGFILSALPILFLLIGKKWSTQRNVASENIYGDSSELDLSNVAPEKFQKAFKTEILKGASAKRTQEGIGVQLGLVLMKDDYGRKISVCDQYPYVDLLFVAEGMAFSGELPQMIVREPCLIADDKKHIASLPIPFQEILNSRTTQTEFHRVLNSQQQMIVYFRNVMGDWPTEWNWTGVTFYQKDTKLKLEINSYEAISVLGAPLIIKANE
ncbi:MAG: hypothetical protein ACXVCY_13280 [Pseudobdellovibrionaceae bacterium]